MRTTFGKQPIDAPGWTMELRDESGDRFVLLGDCEKWCPGPITTGPSDVLDIVDLVRTSAMGCCCC
jgi:hypothetical protein